MPSHTPEPWTAVIDEPADRGGTKTFICAPTKRFVLVGEEADVIRATECVNGCTGLNPTAYRECVEALNEVLDLYIGAGLEGMTPDITQECQLIALKKVREAIRHATKAT